MGGGLYSSEKKNFNKILDLSKIKPYGDTMNDGQVQLSFTLPIQDGDKAIEVARQYVEKMGFEEPTVVYHAPLDQNFTFFVIYGRSKIEIDYNNIIVEVIEGKIMSMKETDEFIKKKIKRKIIVLGATTGTDAHTVGIDAIMNPKGYMGHYGLERYEMIEAYNLGAQVLNEDFIAKAKELKADALLVSQTVTQKQVHIHNLTELVEMLEAEGIRDKILLIVGGPRITNDLAKELGYDAGFGSGKFADDVATFIAQEVYRKMQ